jgi:hypothetical protein
MTTRAVAHEKDAERGGAVRFLWAAKLMAGLFPAWLTQLINELEFSLGRHPD